MECITETARRAASRKGVMQTDSCGASWNSRHGMRNGKRQRSQNVALSECHGKVVVHGFMECNTCGTSWKGVMESDTGGASWKSRHGMRLGNREACSVMKRRHGNHHLLSVTEKVSWKASWKHRGAQRHGKASWKAIPVERHGKAVTECVMESMTQAASRKRSTMFTRQLVGRLI